jgi:eukaryotic-like serine/threonine-protein kinase
LVPSVISHYKILGKIGEGGMGVVYKAHDTKLDRLVALKFLPHHLTPNDVEKARFLREAKAASALNHPNVCTIFDINEENQEQFIVMEFVEGKTLRQMVPLKKSQTAIEYAIQIGDALEEAHSKGIIHRDIKPDNIMVNSRGQIKVMDFGLAKLKGSSKLTKTSSTVGTPAYMAPEQIKGGQVDARSDIFSFGIVLYEMLAGHTPFNAAHEAALLYAIVNEEPVPIQKYRSNLTPGLLQILKRSLEKNPEARYQSVRDMSIELQKARKRSARIKPKTFDTILSPGQATEVAETLQPVQSSSTIRRSNWKKILGVAVASVLVIAGTYLLTKTPKGETPFTPIQLTFVGNVRLVSLSPDGKSIAYSAGEGQIYVEDVSGGQALEVFKCTDCTSLRWSPNGSELAVSGGTNDSTGATFIIPRFGGHTRRLRFQAADVSWSPDGSSIAAIVINLSTIYFIDLLTGGNTAQIHLK